MRQARKTLPLGFALIEALIALLLISIGLIAVSKLQSSTLFGTGDGRARAEAANLSQQKLEELRNLLQKGDFTGLPTLPGSPMTVTGSNAEYTLTWAVTPDPDAKLEQHLIALVTTWTDSRGSEQRLDLNTRVAWDDPGMQAGIAVSTSGTLISPTGSAQRGSGPAPAGVTVSKHQHGVEIRTEGVGVGKTYLIKGDQVVLFLPPNKDGTAQNFVRISGRIIFDTSGLGFFKKGGADPDTSDKVFVRLSSEGECVYDNSSLSTIGSTTYKYFDYTCYVGPGWYGNVGVSTVGDTGSDPAVCVGDPNFNIGKLASSTASPNAAWSATRTYRGFHPNDGGVLLSVGMKSGGRYGSTSIVDKDGVTVADITASDGLPKPSDLDDFYDPDAPTGANDYLRQDFLVTGSKAECGSAMPKTVFQYNAGQYVCISPNQLASPGECPPAWPGAGYADGPGPGGGGTCNVRFEGTADGKPDRITVGYADAPADNIGACEVGTIKGVGTYFCDIKDMPADKLGTVIVLTKHRDPKGKDPGGVIGTPFEYTLPAICPTEKIVKAI